MLNQFHDVLPGTSIKMVNDDVHEIYDRRIAQTETLLEGAIAALLPDSHAMNGDARDSEQVLVLDPLRQPRTEVIPLTSSTAALVPSSQILSDGSGVALISTDSTGLGYVLDKSTSSPPKAQQQGSSFVLSNQQFKLTISSGRITSLVDIASERELILPGPGAQTAGLMLYEDLPLAYDAWDAEIYHLDRPTALTFDEVKITANGPLRASLETVSSFGNSKVTLTVSVKDRLY